MSLARLPLALCCAVSMLACGTSVIIGDPGEDESLEQILEGDRDAAALPTPSSPQKKSSMWRGLIIALFVFVVLGAATVFVLHTLGLIGSGEGENNQDIEIPQ